MPVPKILTNRSAESLERFLAQRAESSLLIRSNARSAGLEDHGCIYEGTYAAFLEKNEVSGVAVHYWNGMVFIQAQELAGDLVRAAKAASRRELAGLAGPWDQVQEVLNDLGISHASLAKNGRETLFSLMLDNLMIPEPLRSGIAICRHPLEEELPTLVNWRMAYCRECLNAKPGNVIERGTHEILDQLQKNRNHWVLETDREIVATSAFNAMLPDMVQVGGVYTPPEFRNRGYARSVVAGALMESMGRGVRQAILFTGIDMAAARSAYTALGFTKIGEYGLVIL
jgi:GNAT superfamily N-acetyltransferase